MTAESPGVPVVVGGVRGPAVAGDPGFPRRSRILPSEGLYLHSGEPAGSHGTNTRPVPGIDRPYPEVVADGIDEQQERG